MQLMLWGEARASRRFDLGMAPLSGLETSDVASLWNRLASDRLRTGRAVLQLPGPARLQGEVPSRLGAPLPRLARGALPGPRARRRLRPHRGRIPRGSSPSETNDRSIWHSCSACCSCPHARARGAAGALETYDVWRGRNRPRLRSGQPLRHSVALFVSGDGGWNQGVVDMAERLRGLGALVVGIDIRTFYRNLAASPARLRLPCGRPRGAVATRPDALQAARSTGGPFSSATPPARRSSIAAPRFGPARDLRGCAEPRLLPRHRDRQAPVPRQGLSCDAQDRAACGVRSLPDEGSRRAVARAPRRHRPGLLARHGQVLCLRDPGASLHALPKVGHGFSVPRNWDPAFVEAWRALTAPRAAPLPLTAVRRSTRPRSAPRRGAGHGQRHPGSRGGRPERRRRLGRNRQGGGVCLRCSRRPYCGWNSLDYFWTPRTPRAAPGTSTRSFDTISRHGEESALLVGYSFGADVLPFLTSRLSADVKARIASVGLIGLGSHAAFEFHVSSWLGGGDDQRFPTGPEVRRLAGIPVVCIQGSDESDSGCKGLAVPPEVETVPGGHHYGGDYAGLVARVLQDVEGERK